MPKAYLRPQASADLAQIWEYIARDDEGRADCFVDLLDGKFRSLAEHPLMGRERTELEPGLRSFPVGQYVIFYFLRSDGVDVVRVLHGARDIEHLFE